MSDVSAIVSWVGDEFGFAQGLHSLKCGKGRYCHGPVHVCMQTCQVVQTLACSSFLCVSDVLDVEARGHDRSKDRLRLTMRVHCADERVDARPPIRASFRNFQSRMQDVAAEGSRRKRIIPHGMIVDMKPARADSGIRAKGKGDVTCCSAMIKSC